MQIKSGYPKDKVFQVSIINWKNELNFVLMKKVRKQRRQHSCLPLRKDISWSSTLYSFKGPFELLHVDIADIRFLAKSAVGPTYCLLFVDLLTSKICTYTMKDFIFLQKKIELFYDKITKKRNMNEEMRIQTD